MKVKELIRLLKQENPNLKVGVAMGDNAEGEVAGWVFSVNEIEELEFTNHTTWAPADKPTGRRVVLLRC